jgi:hypothetical protein
MGYTTTFYLETSPSLPFLNIDQWLMTDANGCCDWEGKYYSHEEMFRELSKKHPNVVFELTGNGEGQMDIWRKYFQNGKMQAWKLETDIEKLADPFNPEKLR